MTTSPLSHQLLADPAYPRLKDHLIALTGLAYYADKDVDLAGVLGLRLDRLGLRDCGAYLALLEDSVRGGEELDTLVERLTIGETFFFRHREMFHALRDVVLPDLLARNQARRQLRVWSAGCATGAEPYSVAILLRRDLAPRFSGWDVSILGTDLNRAFLARGREGVFEEWALRGMSDEVKQACFERVGNAWRIAPRFQEGVSFQCHNLVAQPFPCLESNLFAFDLILCRNVLIYFRPEIIRLLVARFHQSLVEGGWLLVGHAEPNLELFRDFRTVNAPGVVLYQKIEDRGSRIEDRGSRMGDLSSSILDPRSSIFDPQSSPPVWQPFQFPDVSSAPPQAALPEPPVPPAPGAAALAAIRALADRGEWDEAARRCREVLQQDNLNPLVYFYQALVFEQLEQTDATEDALRRALYLDRRFALAHYYLGLLLRRQGQSAQAARSFKNVLQVLSGVSPEQVFAEGDGITAGELRKRTQIHLDALGDV